MTKMDKVLAPRETTKAAMCQSPFLSLVVIGGGFVAGRWSGDVVSAALGGAMSGLGPTALVEFGPESIGGMHIGGHWSSPLDSKVENMVVMGVVGGMAGVAGSLLG